MSVASFLSTAPPPPRSARVSFEEYYAAEQKAEFRSEFIDGVVRPMAGAAPNHILVVASLEEQVRPLLRLTGLCHHLGQDTQIPIPAHNLYTYPDGVIACPPQFAKPPRGALLNPRIIFEVLLHSTEAYDRGDKFLYYRSLETFEEYVLVSTKEPLVEVFARSSSWAVQAYEGLDAVARLESVGLDVPLRELYADVSFVENSTDQAPAGSRGDTGDAAWKAAPLQA